VQHGWRFAKRPGVDYFLAYLSQFYEIVVFTSMQSFNAQPLLDKLDPIGYTMYRLYREATTYDDTKYIKDLSKLNRDLSKVIIMDSNPDAYSLQPENAVAVPPWTGDPNDRYLTEIIPFLETLVIMNVADVRPICQKYYGQDTPQKFAETEARIRDQLRAQWEEQKSKTSVKGLFGMFGSVQKHEQGEPPVPLIEKQRRQLHEAFEKEHARAHTEALQQAQQFQKDQEKAMKEMKLTVWDLVTKGPPQPGLGMDSKS
jgi:import inner membrane translocase subunit TIM50